MASGQWSVASGQWSVLSPIPNPQSLIPNPSRRGHPAAGQVLALLAMFGLVAVTFVVLTGHSQRTGQKSIDTGGAADRPPTPPWPTTSSTRPPCNSSAAPTEPPPSSPPRAAGRHLQQRNSVRGTIITPPRCRHDGHMFRIGAHHPSQRSRGRNRPPRRLRADDHGPDDQPLLRPEHANRRHLPGSTNFEVMAFPNGLLPNANGETTNSPSTACPSAARVWIQRRIRPTQRCRHVRPNDAPVEHRRRERFRWPCCRMPLSVYGNGNPPGGANSDYTAADFQHMLLAAQVHNAAAACRRSPRSTARRWCNYWINRPGRGTDLARPVDCKSRPAAADHAAADRQHDGHSATANPDHPNFTGSNPNFNPTWDGVTPAGQWDVDNDGDGVPDSVWVDLGLPVRSTADGRLYKPLFAILCVDLDGRLNLNAHGSLAQADSGLRRR